MESRQSERNQITAALLSFVDRLWPANGQTYRGLTLFPVYADPESATDGAGEHFEYRVLVEALAAGWAEVTECDPPTVSALTFHNRGRSMVFVLDGEEIVGGQQNRVANASYLVDAGTTVVVPVSCVEQGRWRRVSDRFQPGESSFYHLRRDKQHQVRASLRAVSQPIADQSAIWSELDRRQRTSELQSPTGAMHDLFRSRADEIEEYERALPYPAPAVGLIAAFQGWLLGADLFDRPATAAALWPRLVRALAFDALDAYPDAHGPAIIPDQALGLLTAVRRARAEVYPSPALGADVRLVGRHLAGSALVYAGQTVHLSLFAGEASQGERHNGRNGAV